MPREEFLRLVNLENLQHIRLSKRDVGLAAGLTTGLSVWKHRFLNYIVG